jgi:ADP-ribose pyrophosphatase YjhB (NUDIX family)
MMMVLLKNQEKHFSNMGQIEKKEAVTAVMFYGGKVLAVSRKTDFNDFGLPGGKLDPGENHTYALCREVFEETGLTPIEFEPVFNREDGEYKTTTYLVKRWIGQIVKREAGLIEWVDYDVIEKGSFGIYNTQLKDRLTEKFGTFDPLAMSGLFEIMTYHSLIDWAERFDSSLKVSDFDCSAVTIQHRDKSSLLLTNCKVCRFLVPSPFVDRQGLEELVVVFSEHHRAVTYFLSDLIGLMVDPKEIVKKYTE